MSHYSKLLSFSLLFVCGGFLLNAAEVVAPNAEKLAQVQNGTLTEAYASWWGFNPEDSTEILQAALDSKVAVLYVDKMAEPWTVRPLEAHGDMEIILEEDVTIQAKAGEFMGMGDALISIGQESNTTIRGGRGSTLLMRKHDYQNPPYTPSEWRHAINLRGSKNTRIENLVIRASGGDGIYVGSGGEGFPCENTVIRNVFCDDNNRQGVTVISARNLLIEDSIFANTSGAAPEAGIDIEPNKDHQCLVNCVVRKCVFSGNAGDGIEIFLPNLSAKTEPISIVIEDCISQWNGRNGLSHLIENGDGLTLQGELTLRNIDIRNNKFALEIASKGIDGHAMNLENITLDHSICKDPTVSPITLITCLADQYPMGKMVWDNITIIDPMQRKPVFYVDRTPFNYGLFDITGSMTLKKDVDDPGTKVAIDDAWLTENFPGSRQCGFLPVEPKTEAIVPSTLQKAPIDNPSEMIYRNEAKQYLYGTQGVPMKFSLVQRRHHPTYFMKDEIIPTLTSPSGKKVKLSPFTTEVTPYEFTPDETGIWTLKAGSDEHDILIPSCSVPNGSCCFTQGTFASANATYYFAVPEGTERFALGFLEYDKEPGTITVIDPNGNERWVSDGVISGAVLFENKEKATPGVWTVKMKKEKDAPNDFFITFYGIAGFLSTEPDKTIVQP